MRTHLLDAADPLFMGGRMRFFAALYEDLPASPTFWPAAGCGPAARTTRGSSRRSRTRPSPDSGVWTETVLPSPGWEFPVEVYERHRNARIHARQGNRNPFIDHPDWAERTPLARGQG